MKSKIWLILGAAVACIVLAALATWKFSSGIPVEAAPARMDRIREFVDERGKTRLPETYLITMPFAGRIETISLTEGSPVRKGDSVARIVPRDLELQVQLAEAAIDRLDANIQENADVQVEETAFQQAVQFVESTKATVKAAETRVQAGLERYKYAEKKFGRMLDLFTKGVQSEEAMDLATEEKEVRRWDYRQDELVHAAMQSLELATNLMPTMVRQFIDRKNLAEAVLLKQKAEADIQLQQVKQDEARGTMRSPVDGVVLKRSISNERFLSAGTALLEIGRLEDLEVDADVLSLDVVNAKVGDPVEIYGPAIGRPPARGTVERIYPAGFTKISSLGVEQQRVKVIVRFHRDDLKRLLGERHLGVDYRVRVRIFTADKPQALVIPRSAIFRGTDGSWQVYAIRNGRAEIRKIRTGLINDELVEVLEGLSEGQQVVLAPESNLANGARVKLEEAKR